MGLNRAKFVRWVALDEARDELVSEARALTWEAESEHTLVELDSGELVLASGGPTGVEFLVEGEAGGRTLHMEIDGRTVRVVRILWHTHPRVTGPSDGDLEALTILGQPDSIIFEIGGDKGGTRIRPKTRANGD